VELVRDGELAGVSAVMLTGVDVACGSHLNSSIPASQHTMIHILPASQHNTIHILLASLTSEHNTIHNSTYPCAI